MSTITSILSSDIVANSRSTINTNFTNLNTDKIENLANLGVTANATELNYSVGVTSALQTQLNTKATTASPIFTGTVTVPVGNGITGLVKTVYKTADETVNNSSTLQDDNELFFAIDANEVWSFDVRVLINSPLAADFKGSFSIPTGGTVNFVFDDFLFGTIADQTQFLTASTGNTPEMGTINAIATNGSTAGNVVFRWAQQTATVGNTKVLKGSNIIAHRLA